MMPDPDPLDVTNLSLAPSRWPTPADFDAMSERAFRAYVIRIGFEERIKHALGKHGWYLLASFVTGLLLGAAVARVVGL